MDTIYALATPPGRSGVAVIRVSGPDSANVCRHLCGDVPPPRMASVRQLTAADGTVLDEALVLTFVAPNSFTGEDSVEFHVHGSTAVVAAVVNALAEVPSVRQADPGEFTERAFANGKLDLAQVEGLSDLIEAQTGLQLKQAQVAFSGSLSRTVDTWRSDLIRAAALLEATIDFADEEVPVDVSDEVQSLLAGVADALADAARQSKHVEQVREGFEVAIVGPPNAGKSTLLNYIAGRDAALTSEFAGTTRDVIEVRMDLDGLPVTFLDTAGVRETEDVLEKAGVDLAVRRADQADLRIFLGADENAMGLPDVRAGDLSRSAKSDLGESYSSGVSGVTGDGVEQLLSAVKSELLTRVSGSSVATRRRHVEAFQASLSLLEGSVQAIDSGVFVDEIVAEDIRTAIRKLEFVVGRIDVENLLDVIFSSFCIGK